MQKCNSEIFREKREKGKSSVEKRKTEKELFAYKSVTKIVFVEKTR